MNEKLEKLNRQKTAAEKKLPPQYSPEFFSKVMEQVENFEENN